ncbi:MAG: hypothetical protein ACM3UV_00720 [Nocardioidaceae bacterium]
MDIGQGSGLAAASGVRPFLPPLLSGALARGDIGLDYDGTGWRFLESTGFLLAVLALAVLTYGAERSARNVGRSDTQTATLGRGDGRSPLQLAFLALGMALGALMFAGALAEGGSEAWPGLIAGAACATLAYVALGGLFGRARRRLDAGAAGLLIAYAEGAALALAALAVFVPPVSFLALAAFAVLLLRGGRRDDRKYAGLRVLR